MFDTHAHLADEQYNKDRDEVIKRAKSTGINYILDCGWNEVASKKTVENAQKYELVFSAVGIHPHDAKSASSDYIDIIYEFTKKEKVVAIGEIGLDFYRNLSAPEIQKRVFEEQLLLAKKLSLPVVIHSRKAVKNVIEIVKKINYFHGVFHSVSASYKDVNEIIEMGFYVSVNGALTFDSKKTKEWLLKIPLDRLLVETDCPYLTPVPFRGKRNEPAYLKYVIRETAITLGMKEKEIESITQENGKRLFKIV